MNTIIMNTINNIERKLNLVNFIQNLKLKYKDDLDSESIEKINKFIREEEKSIKENELIILDIIIDE